MGGKDALARAFDRERGRLLGVARRILGSHAEAEDAVQEAWIRLDRQDPERIENLPGWLTTVVARLCLDILESKPRAKETPWGADFDDGAVAGPEEDALWTETMGAALMVVLDRLEPAERTAFVLHDLFGLKFGEIAPVLDRTVEATRKLASRARRRLREARPSAETDPARQYEVVTSFLAAAREGRFDALMELLDPDVELFVDSAAGELGAGARSGAGAVAALFDGGAQTAFPMLLGAASGAAWVLRGEAKVAFDFTVEDGRITAIRLIGGEDALRELVPVALPR
ncbi:sigma-70 family RNA polymerase sigma factor [Salininema proteolyticum]|uniref:Sigma-70 family RNA polymerase sigma factor n=1 Tax=Salininema proteolyticum TaxID=1607685 RepID=A0ABV8U497_9ACTN